MNTLLLLFFVALSFATEYDDDFELDEDFDIDLDDYEYENDDEDDDEYELEDDDEEDDDEEDDEDDEEDDEDDEDEDEDEDDDEYELEDDEDEEDDDEDEDDEEDDDEDDDDDEEEEDDEEEDDDDDEDDEDEEDEDEEDDEEDEEEDDDDEDDDDDDQLKKANALKEKDVVKDLDDKERRKQLLEKWTKLKMGKVIFDTKKGQEYKTDNNQFSKAVEGKKNLVIVIQDSDGNKFGGFVGAKIKPNKWIDSKHCFLFLLHRTDGRRDLKFDHRYPTVRNNLNKAQKEEAKKGFKLGTGSKLFEFGGRAISLLTQDTAQGKVNSKDGVYDFIGQKFPFSDKDYGNPSAMEKAKITVKRIGVIQFN